MQGMAPNALSNHRSVSKPLPSYDLAIALLGKGFITPAEIVAKYPSIMYTEEQLDALAQSFPSDDELHWLQENNFILLPGPSASLRILDIYGLHSPHFKKTRRWPAEGTEMALQDDSVEGEWIAFRKEAVPGSFGKDWRWQQALLSEVEVVPNVAEALWCMMTYKVIRGIFLLSSAYLRTSSRCSSGHRIYVGNFDERGPMVFNYGEGHRHGVLGVASCRKF